MGQKKENTDAVWAIRTAEIPFKDEMGSGHHCLTLLVDETDPQNPHVMEELHFVPAGRGSRASKTRPLIAQAFSRSHQNPKEFSVMYEAGAPLDILNKWNGICEAALHIHNSHLYFSNTNTCRSAAKVAVEHVGYTFQTMAGKITPVLDVGAPETPHIIGLDGQTVLSRYMMLHAELEILRMPSPDAVPRHNLL